MRLTEPSAPRPHLRLPVILMAERLFPDIPAGETIREISPLPSDPNLRRIRVGRRVVARLRAAEVDRLGLAVGMTWSDALAEQVRLAVERGKARKRAFTALGRKPLSRSELIERLIRAGHDEETATAVADELASDGWLDDAALAREIVQQTLARRPAGRQLLIEKIRKRGIEEELDHTAVDEALDRDDPTESALQLAEQRYRSMHSLPPATAARRLAGLLHRRGFDDETVETVINRMGLSDAE